MKGFRSRHNETRLYHLHLVKLTLDERKTLTKVSTRKTSHKHSPKQAHTSERENQQTRQKVSCIARGEKPVKSCLHSARPLLRVILLLEDIFP